MPHFYFSFVINGKFAGATVVQGDNIASALSRSHELGLNPGGEVLSLEIPPDKLERPDVKMCIGRLASKEELQALGAKRLGDMRKNGEVDF